MNFHSFSKDADVVLSLLEKSINSTPSVENFNLNRKIIDCPYHIILVGSKALSRPINLGSESQKEQINVIHHAWRVINKSNDLLSKEDHFSRELLGKIICKVPRMMEQSNTLLYKFRDKRKKNVFIFLIRQWDLDHFSVDELYPILMLWQLNKGHIPLHASGIFHKGRLLLFSGPSGTGKSTVADYSLELGDDVLDQDQVMVFEKRDGSFAANAWGYSLKQSVLPIGAFFRLKQDTENRLIALSKIQTSRLIFEQCMEVTGKNLPVEQYRKLHVRIARFSHSVPGYELHFRKSPDFWKMIDAEIPFN